MKKMMFLKSKDDIMDSLFSCIGYVDNTPSDLIYISNKIKKLKVSNINKSNL
jgi:hypothetical protein